MNKVYTMNNETDINSTGYIISAVILLTLLWIVLYIYLIPYLMKKIDVPREILVLVSIVLVVVFFTVGYYLISHKDPTSFSTGKPLSFWESFYFSMITQSTVGYGDIAPQSNMARTCVAFQLFALLGALGTGLGTV